MAVTEVTHENWFSRIIESLKGIVIGIILFLLAFPLLFWNEGRAVKTARSLSEGAAAVESISPDSIDAAYDGKLVHFNGEVTSETLADSTFGVSKVAIKLRRSAEMYQWKENSKTETRKKVGGGEEKVTTYTYEKTWSSSPISSGSFKEAGHDNPGAMPYESQTWTAQTVTVGKFTLSPGLLAQIDAWKELRVDDAMKALASPDLKPNLIVTEGKYYIPARIPTQVVTPPTGQPTQPGMQPTQPGMQPTQPGMQPAQPMQPVMGGTPASPQIGDMRLSYQVIEPTQVSVVAQQQGANLQPYPTMQKGYDIELLETGFMTADQMFEAAQKRNTMMTWILRLVGFIMMFAGLSMVGRPIAVVADFIPMIGSFFRVGIGLFAFLLSFGFSLITIAIAWVFYRPLLGILLLSLGALGFVGLIAAAITIGRKRLGKKEEEPEPEGA